MFNRIFRSLIIIVGLTVITSGVRAEDRASLDEAQAMCEKAAAYLKENGIDAARDAFHAPGAPWHDRDLYVFVFEPGGVTVAHGAKEALVGRDLTKLRDVDGKLFLQEIISVADRGWVEYKWQNPVSKKVEAKASYVINTGDYIVGVGAYK